MRGVDVFSEQLFTAKRPDDFIPATQPFRPVREMVNAGLQRLDGLFEGMYEPSHKGGRPSVEPEKLARAMLLKVFYRNHSERQLMEQVQFNLLFRWFIGLSMNDAVWVPTMFTNNRQRLIEDGVVVACPTSSWRFPMPKASCRVNTSSCTAR